MKKEDKKLDIDEKEPKKTKKVTKKANNKEENEIEVKNVKTPSKKAQKGGLFISSNEITTNASFNLLEVIIIILITGVVVSIVSGLIVYNNYGRINDINSKEYEITDKELTEFKENYNLIINNYVEEVDKKELLDAAIGGMYNYLGDEYSTYMDQSETDTLENQLEGEYEGIGVLIQTYITDTENITIVAEIYKDSPAERAGMQLGDIIKSIDGIELKDKDSAYFADYVKKGNKTSFEVVVTRNDKDIKLNLNREHVYINSVSSSTEGNVGYIRISTFSKTTKDQVKKAIDEFTPNIKSLVIDLRDNTGGLLDSAFDTSELFVEKDKNIYLIKDREGNITSFKAQEPVYRKFDKIAVLINGNSASASEILTLALKESSGAIVVGTKSYGKGTVQETKMLDSEAMVKFTTAYWLSPNGNTINKLGITPDVIEEDINKQYDRAIEAVK